MNNETLKFKQQAAKRAVAFVESGMVVGLGTGSTAVWAVRTIAEFLEEGRLQNIIGVPTSEVMALEARKVGIPLTTLEDHPMVDVTIDGADEVDPKLDVIKGGGGALLREKIVAQASKRFVIIVDESKPSPTLGTKWALPVEVIPFGWRSQLRFIEGLGAKVTMRTRSDGSHFITDHGNLIFDCNFGLIKEPDALDEALNARVGIVEHGLFLSMATDLITAGPNGIYHRQR